TEDDPNPQLLISEIVPWVEGTAHVQLRHGEQVLDQRSAVGSVPTVSIQPPDLTATTATFQWTAADADGDPLTFTLLYSADNGTMWQSLATGLTESRYSINQGDLPGGPESRIRVLANDGFLTGEATSAPFTLASSAPNVTILSPTAGSTMYVAQPVTLAGSATDVEDGLLEGASL